MNYTVNTKSSSFDPRDYLFIPESLGPFPSSLDLMPFVEEVEDQAQYGTCVANAICSNCETIAKRNGQTRDLSRMYLYKRGRDISGLGPDTEGMIPRDALKAAKAYGMPSEAMWPYAYENQFATAPASVDSAAALSRIGRYEAVVPPSSGMFEPDERIARIKAALNENNKVDVAVWVTESLRHLTGDWKTHQYKFLSEDDLIGGHEFEVIGYDDSVGMFLCQNSWGPNWGDGGFFGIRYGVVSEPGFEAWVVRDYAGMYNRESPGLRLEMMNFANIRARIVPPVELIGQTKKLWIVALNPSDSNPSTRWRYKPDLNANGFAAIPSDGIVPHCAEITLQDTYEDIYVLRDYDIFGNGIRPFAGWQIFIGYGDFYDLNHLTYANICTIPNNL